MLALNASQLFHPLGFNYGLALVNHIRLRKIRQLHF
jgi:hypothetical protein